MDVETVLSPEELLEQSKTKSTFQLIGNFLSNVKNKLNCSKSKSDFYKNLKEIGDRFDNAVSVPTITKVQPITNTSSFDVHTNYIKTTPNISIIESTTTSNEYDKVNQSSSQKTDGHQCPPSSTPLNTTTFKCNKCGKDNFNCKAHYDNHIKKCGQTTGGNKTLKKRKSFHNKTVKKYY